MDVVSVVHSENIFRGQLQTGLRCNTKLHNIAAVPHLYSSSIKMKQSIPFHMILYLISEAAGPRTAVEVTTQGAGMGTGGLQVLHQTISGAQQGAGENWMTITCSTYHHHPYEALAKV